MALERPDVRLIGDAYELTWPITGVRLAFDRLVEHRDGLFSEVTFAKYVPDQSPRLLLDVRFNLLSTTTKAQVARSLGAQMADVDWPNLLETGSYLVKHRFRNGDPAIDLATVSTAARRRWVIYPYLASDRPAVLFGAGGCGKSFFSLAIALSCLTGVTIVGRPLGPPQRVLMLDYESDQYEHRERVRALCVGAGMADLSTGYLYYRRMTTPLNSAGPALRREIGELGIGLVVIDSLAGAAGELEESGPILQCFASIRSFGAPTLVISHINRGTMVADEANGRRRLWPFGSVYTENSAGNTWSLRRRGEEGEHDGSVLLVHEKTNNDRYQPRHAYRVTFCQAATEEQRLTSVAYRSEEYGESFADHLPLGEILIQTLRRGGPRNPADLFTDLPDQRPASIRATLSKLKAAGRVVQLQTKEYALAAGNGYDQSAS